MKVTIPARTHEITRCYHTCPYFGLDGGPSPAMYCKHPYWDDKGSYAGFIISHPECDDGFPSMCPLYKENGITPPVPPVSPIQKSYVTKEEQQNLSIDEILKLEYQRRFDEVLLDALLKLPLENKNNLGT